MTWLRATMVHRPRVRPRAAAVCLVILFVQAHTKSATDPSLVHVISMRWQACHRRFPAATYEAIVYLLLLMFPLTVIPLDALVVCLCVLLVLLQPNSRRPPPPPQDDLMYGSTDEVRV